ncbi:MAG TPA: hypothetical protein VMV77_15935 [Bacteroidales bacterium]|nr:hypothetical protein [Bacteroidales bacterium]
MKTILPKSFSAKRVVVYSGMIMLLLLSSALCYGQDPTNKEFIINDFVVTITSIRGERDPSPWRINESTFPRRLENEINGTGVIVYKTERLPVKLKGIKLKYNRQTRRVEAVSGIVKGNSRNIVEYKIGDYDISFKWSLIEIKPESSSVPIRIKIPLHSCSTAPLHFISMSSENCQIWADGSVYSNNFSGSTEFPLKESVYTASIYNNKDGIIKLGRSVQNNRPSNGAYLKGRDLGGLFNMKLFVLQDAGDSRLEFNLQNPIDRKLEYNLGGDQYYFLRLLAGSINFYYNEDTLSICKGLFKSNLKLPSRYNNILSSDGQQNDTLKIELFTDQTNALFDTIDIVDNYGERYLLNIGPVSFEASAYKAWAYFPNWLTNSSSYISDKSEPSCEELMILLKQANNGNGQRWDRNPGLTISRGTVYLTSPQIDYNHREPITEDESKTVKSYFTGFITLTPYGAQGTVSSNGNTFVPYTYQMDQCTITENYLPSTWDQIIEKGDTLPEDVEELFRIQKLKILEMRLRRMRLCKGEIDRGSTIFRYYVHFPYPSYLSLEFEDKSFDSNGTFSKAYGPIVPLSQEILSNWDPSGGEELGSGSAGKRETIQVPVGHIFWAWRLPVTFADRGIEINYPGLISQPDKGITIMMNNQNVNSLGEIYGNELSLAPLYSDNSAFKKGVRFGGFLSGEGMFRIDTWDKRPFFGKFYSKKFRCDLSDVTLAPLGSSPTQRVSDFQWKGALQFPFFSYSSDQTWIPVEFQVKDIVPAMPFPIEIQTTIRQRLKCEDGEQENVLTNETFSLTVNGLRYDDRQSGFLCDRIRKNDTGPMGSLQIFSYSHALLVENNLAPRDTILTTTVDNSCNNNKTVIERLHNCYISTGGITDLVCYDPDASAERSAAINNQSCCSVFYYGTYQIITKTSAVDSTVTLSATNVKYYPYEPVNKLSLDNSKMSFRSDDTSDGENQIIDIPGMQLAFTDQGYFGAFGSTYTDVAFSLPYEGEFRFFLDPKCGYFYMLGAGSFTIYGIPLRGQVFILHAPRRVLDTHPFTSYNTTSLLEDMTIRSLSRDVTAFLSDTQLDAVNSNAVITGCLTSGVASYGINRYGIDFLVQVGITNYFYHSNSNNTFRVGSFGSVNASASLDLLLFSVGIEGWAKLALGLSVEFGNYDNIIESLHNTDIILKGKMGVEGCVGLVLLGECCAGFECGASLSTENGLRLDEFDLYSCCDCGN